MPRPPPGQYFLEIFAGEAVLTRAMQSANFPCLPPIELEVNQFIPFSIDVTDPRVLDHLMMLIQEGFLAYVHCGTPCSSFSLARKGDGGPPPLRSRQELWGLPRLAPWDQDKVKIGNRLMQITVDVLTACHHRGILWSVENPLGSYLWLMPPMRGLAALGARIEFDMCQFGSPHMKPTAILTSAPLQALAQRCDRDVRPHDHVALVGTEIVRGKKQFKTKRAQVYPLDLCQQWASLLTFTMTTPAGERKRPLGQPVPWSGHRQEATGQKAIAAGYQLKKSVLPPAVTGGIRAGHGSLGGAGSHPSFFGHTCA